MKKISVILALVLGVCILGCNNSNDLGTYDNSQQGGDGDYSFEDQNLQGIIEEQPYEFVSGYARVDSVDDTKYYVTLYDIEPGADLEPWEAGAYQANSQSVIFLVPQEEGVYELAKYPADPDSNQSATLVQKLDNTYINHICYLGAIEITSIDLEEGTLEGRVDARDGYGSEVNGNFSVPVAPEEPAT